MEITHGRFKIAVDEYQYTLYAKADAEKAPKVKRVAKAPAERKPDGKKPSGYREVGYYSSFEHMLHRMVKLEMLANNKGEKFSLEGFIQRYKDTMDYFKKEIVEPLHMD